MNWQKAKNKEKHLLVPIVTIFCIIGNIVGEGCLWRALFNIPCPGCGFTRALLSAFRLDFEAAYRYHPLYWSFVFIVLYFVFEGEVFKNKKLNLIVASLLVLGFLVVWFNRLINGFEL